MKKQKKRMPKEIPNAKDSIIGKTTNPHFTFISSFMSAELNKTKRRKIMNAPKKTQGKNRAQNFVDRDEILLVTCVRISNSTEHL